MKAVKIALASLLIYATQASAQMQYSAPAVDAEGMGGVEASLPSDNAVVQLANPAQTGFFSLHGIASMAAYLPAYSSSSRIGNGIDAASMFSTAAEFGIDLQKYLQTPFKISAGIGYARTGADASGGGEIVQYEWQNRADNLIMGLGFDDVVKIGVGMGFNWISSVNNFPGAGRASVVAHSYGAIVQVPVLRLIEGGSERDGHNGNGHFANFTIAYALRDVGGYFAYDSNPVDEGTLFRQADLGINLELGIESTFDGKPWKIVSVMFAREAEIL
ncbi:MAG: hypothetical protein M1339_00460, partial [Bacteroidetes bacterium]|nr:hypothetical protein [Bacteroidota bacterium]